MQIALIVAMSRNLVIGKDNAMPWHLPEDLRYFKRITLHKPVVMGRNTFESIGRPLPQRVNVVVTRNTDYRPHGASVVHSFESALEFCDDLLRTQGQPEDAEVMIVGGAQIYAQALPHAERLYLTEVHTEVDGDASFPDFDRNEWQEISRHDHPASSANPHPYSFVVLERRS